MRGTKIHIASYLMSLLMSALVSFSAMMCLVDGFGLRCEPRALFFVCCAAALASTSAMLLKYTGVVSLSGLALCLIFVIWQQKAVESSLLALVYDISDTVSDYYILIDTLGEPGVCVPTLYILALPLAWTTAWVICRQGNTLLLLLLCLPVLVLSLIIVDLAPVFWLVLLTFCMLVLLVSHGVREHNAEEAGRLAWWIFLPTVILVAGITVLWPPADYERSDWVTELQTFAESKISLESIQEDLPASYVGTELGEVDLSKIGPKSMTGRRVLQYQAEVPITYLRGASMGKYRNNTWETVEEDLLEDYDLELPVPAAMDDCLLQVVAMREEPVLYYPYYSTAMLSHDYLTADAFVRNENALREYTVTYRSGRPGTALTEEYRAFVHEFYTQVPSAMEEELEAYLTEQGWDTVSSAEELAGLVKASAVYDLNTPRIPDGEDFVLYFLRESDRGYCVHFASATVMLLRSMEIPARYVTGYVANGLAGQWNAVTENDAHAWVEYYEDDVGWIPLDPTPLDLSQELQPEPEALPEEQPEEEIKPAEQPDEERQDQLPSAAVPEEASAAKGPLLLLIPVVMAVFPLRRWLILRSRRYRCRTGHPNQRAMALWGWLVQLARAEGTSVEEEQICLAEKARFSQHTLTEEELALLEQALEERVARLKQRPLRERLWHRYGNVLY